MLLNEIVSHLNELLNNSYEYKMSMQSYDTGYYGQFDIDDGARIKVILNEIPAIRGYMISFKRDGSFNITGGGDALRILATIVDLLKDFVKRVKPSYICFSALKTETSRIKLYERMISKLTPALNYEDVTKQVEAGTDKKSQIINWYSRMSPNYQFMVLARKT